MSEKSAAAVKTEAKPSLNADKSGLLQRKCDCGNAAGLTGECSECQQKKLTVQRREKDGGDVEEVPAIVHELFPLQAKLTVGKPGDIYEQEADRIADRVMQMPNPQRKSGLTHTPAIEPLSIQRMGSEEDNISRIAMEEEKPIQKQAEEEESSVQMKEEDETKVLQPQIQPIILDKQESQGNNLNLPAKKVAETTAKSASTSQPLEQPNQNSQTQSKFNNRNSSDDVFEIPSQSQTTSTDSSATNNQTQVAINTPKSQSSIANGSQRESGGTVNAQESQNTERESIPKAEFLSNPSLSNDFLANQESNTSATQTRSQINNQGESTELNQFLQQVEVEKESIIQEADRKKQQIRTEAQTQKANAQQSILDETTKLEEIFNQAIQKIQQSTLQKRTQILSERDVNIEATRKAAQTEINNLKQTVQEKQTSLYKIGDEKAQAILSTGQEQSQLAIDVSNQKSAQAYTIASSKSQQYIGSENGGDITQGANQIASKVAPKILQYGSDISQASLKGANDLANSFQQSGNQLAEKFNQAFEDGQQKILQTQEDTISALNQIADESISKLETSNSEAISKLESEKQNSLQQLQTNSEQAISKIDETAGKACVDLDRATIQATTKLNNFSAEVSNYLSSQTGEAAAQTLQAAQTQLNEFRSQWNGGLNGFVANTTQILQEQVNQIQQQVSQQVTEATTPVQQAATDFETKASEAITQVSQKMTETVSKSTETMQKVTTDTDKELQNKVSESESKFNTGLAQGKAQLTGMVDKGLAQNEQALSQMSANVSSMATKASSTSILGAIGDFLWGIVEGFVDAIVDIFKGIGNLLSTYWENLKKGDFWTWVITIIVVIVVIVLALTGLLGVVLAFLAEVLLYVGIFLGSAFATYYLLTAIFTPGLSWEERGKYVGRALFEILLLLLSWKGASAAGKASRLEKLVPNAKLLARLKAVVSDEAKLIELLETWKDAEKLADILEKAGDVGRAEALLKQFGSLEELWQLLQKPDITVTVLEDLLKIPSMTATDLKELLKVPSMTITELKELLKITDSVPQLKKLLTHIEDPLELKRLINEAGLKPGPDPDALRLERVLDKMGSGKKNIPDVESALEAQKKIDNKILLGEQKGTTPGTADFRTIRGAHSPKILTDPNYQIISQTPNSDGTIVAKFKKLISPGPPAEWSKTKTSTLAPSSWSDSDILRAGDQIAKEPPIISRISDRATLHRGTVNSVQWEVIKDASGKVTSSYPTGGNPTINF
ncbi:MAG: EndoU domain-containing protein [Waterburya sp.]